MSKLDDCLLTIEKNVKLSDKTVMKIHSESKQQIKDLFNELIGEDELTLNRSSANQSEFLDDWQAISRNDLRKELRQKVQEL